MTRLFEQARDGVVNLVTLEEHNHYDDGHVLMEIFDPREKRWILYDPDMKCRFRHAGRYLNLGEAVALYRKGGAAELEFFCPPAIDVGLALSETVGHADVVADRMLPRTRLPPVGCATAR